MVLDVLDRRIAGLSPDCRLVMVQVAALRGMSVASATLSRKRVPGSLSTSRVST